MNGDHQDKTYPAVVGPSDKASELVNHPDHYGGAANPYEVIKVLRAWLTPEQYAGFLIGNALKYQARAGKKDSREIDLRKADWYLTEYLRYLKEIADDGRQDSGS